MGRRFHESAAHRRRDGVRRARVGHGIAFGIRPGAGGEGRTRPQRCRAQFVNANPGTPKHIYCTYTAMLAIRAELATVADVADAGVGK